MDDARTVISSTRTRGWETKIEKRKVARYASRENRRLQQTISLQHILLRDVKYGKWRPPPEHPMHEIRECDKGMGMFATCDIQRHQCLLVEAPIVVDGNIEAQVEKLDDLKNKSFWDLHDCHASAGKTVVGIYRTNAFPLGPRGEGLFPILSRMNHSCKPNAQIIWDDQRGATLLITCQHIAKGEEVVHSFLPAIDLPRARRLEFLKRRFGFECKCVVCAAPIQVSALSDERRLLISCLGSQLGNVMHVLKKGIGELGHDLIQQGLEAVSKQLHMLRMEGVELTTIRKLTFDAYRLTCVGGDMSSAVQWLEVYRRYAELTEGPQSQRAQQAALLTQNPRQGMSL